MQPQNNHKWRLDIYNQYFQNKLLDNFEKGLPFNKKIADNLVDTDQMK